MTEKRMFGGVAFMVRGHMACGLMSDGGFMVRVAGGRTAEMVRRPHARVMEQKGRVMRGFILITPEGVADDGALRGWIDDALAYNATLAAKP
jgi:hypothetical protein